MQLDLYIQTTSKGFLVFKKDPLSVFTWYNALYKCQHLTIPKADGKNTNVKKVIKIPKVWQ